jgi:hypothetical protein
MGAFSDLRLSFRRAVLLAALVGALTFAAGAGAQATTVTHLPISFAVTNICTGELVALQGFFHAEVHQTNSGLMHVELNLQDMKGTSLTAKYVANSQSSATTSVPPGTFENTEMISHMIRQKDDGTFVLGDDFKVKTRVQFVTDHNGVVRVNNIEATTDPCQ